MKKLEREVRKNIDKDRKDKVNYQGLQLSFSMSEILQIQSDCFK